MAAHRFFRLGAVLLMVAMCLLANSTATTAAMPEIRLIPDRGPCVDDAQLVRIVGANLPPGGRITAVMNRPEPNGSRSAVVQGDWRVGQDGKLDSTIYVGGCPPTTPDGTLFIFDAYIENAAPLGPNSDGEVKIATTIFTVDSTAPPVPALPSPPRPGLPNTGQGGMAPTLVLTPSQGPCTTPFAVTLRGEGFRFGVVPSYSYGIREEGIQRCR